MKETLKNSKEGDKPIEEALWVKAVGAFVRGPSIELDTSKTIGEYFTPPTTTVNASLKPGAIVDVPIADDVIIHSTSYEISA